MAFEGLTEKIAATFKKLRGKGRLKEADVKEAMREIRMALLEADVSYKVCKDFTKAVTERCVGADVLEALSPARTARSFLFSVVSGLFICPSSLKTIVRSNSITIIQTGGKNNRRPHETAACPKRTAYSI